MKYIVIGLGKLGKVLAEALTSEGNDVIGVDVDMKLVEASKDTISETICMDTQDENVMKTLPLKDTNAIFVTYGEDIGSSVSTTAILKMLNAPHLIVRSISPIHETILKAMGVDEIISPEFDYAQAYVSRNQFGTNFVHWYKITATRHVIQVKIPESFIGSNIRNINFEDSFNLKLIAILRLSRNKNFLGQPDSRLEVLDNIDENSIFENGDQLVLFGEPIDYNKLVNV